MEDREKWVRLPSAPPFINMEYEIKDKTFIKNMFNPSKEYLEEASNIIKNFDNITITETKDGFVAEIKDKGCCDNW